jgi:virulence factor Mce-like protein
MARARRTNVLVGLLLVAGAIGALYYAFARPNPFADPFVVKAVLSSGEGIRPGLTPVRVAGVEVGRVDTVESFRGSRSSLITMHLHDDAPQVHADAALKLRPRLFLEGNSFVDLSPGTPGSGPIREGATIPLRQTSVYVPLPHVLGALTQDTRRDLQHLIQEYGAAVIDAAPELNAATEHAAQALPDSAVVADAFADAHLNRAIEEFGKVAETLDQTRLDELLKSLRGSSAAFARESTAVTQTLDRLPSALRTSRTALRATADALPHATELAAATTDALPALDPALRHGVPWLGQLGALLGPRELGGAVASLQPAASELASGAKPFTDLLHNVDRLSRCSTKVLVPTANAKIDDGPRTTGATTWHEFLSAAVGASGAAQNFDGNGYLLRGHPGGGTTAVATSAARFLGLPLYGNAIAPPQGTRPAMPARNATHSTATPCLQSTPPNLNAAPTGR